MRGVVQLRGDFGNPKGTGYAKLRVDNLESADAATGLTDMDTFADSLKTGGFTDCNVGNTKVTVFSGQNAAKPASNVNVDSQLIVMFRKGTEEQVRKLTIPGIDVGSTLLEEDSAGLRLTTAGAATLAGYIDTLFGWTSQAVIISGKCLVKA
jgi:hypothetical protein